MPGFIQPFRTLSFAASMTLLAWASAQTTHAQSRIEALGFGEVGTSGLSTPGVSSDGSIVVGSIKDGSTFTPVRWTESGGIVSFGGTSTTGFALDVTDNGDAVIVSGINPSGSYRWTETGGYEALDFNVGSMSSDGTFISGTKRFESRPPNNQFEAVRWQLSGDLEGLGDIEGGNDESYGTAISGDGTTVVGASRGTDQLFRAFRWTPETGMVALGVLDGYDACQAMATSEDGTYVVGRCDKAGTTEAVIWDNGSVRGIGASFSNFTEARLVSQDGSLIVIYGFVPSLGQFSSLLWENGSSLRTVEDVFSVDYGIDLSEWEFLRVTDMSADGTVMVGFGRTTDGVTDAFRVVLDPCERVNGKRPAECECKIDEYVLTGDGELIDFKEAGNWDRNAVPGENDLLFLPQRADTFVVIADQPYGALKVEGDVVLLNSLESRDFQLTGPCGEALVITGRNDDFDPGSFLEIQASEARIDGNIIVPGRPNTVGDLLLGAGTIHSDKPILADLGNFDSFAVIGLESRSEWLTPMALVTLHSGVINIEGESKMHVGQIELGKAIGTDHLSWLSVVGDSELRADSLYAGSRSHAGLWFKEDSGIYLKRLETSSEAGGTADIHIDGGFLDVEVGVLGTRDTTDVVLDTLSFFVYTVLTLGQEEEGVATMTVRGFLGTLEDLSILILGEHGDGGIVLESRGNVSASIMVLGREETGFGYVEIRGEDDNERPDLKASGLDVGFEGEGVIDLRDGWIQVNDREEENNSATLILGVLPSGKGTIEMAGTSDLDVNRLVVGESGRGDLKVMDDSRIVANLIVVGDSARGGGFGSMNVSGTSFVSANGICVGCIDGLGLLGVIDNAGVETNFLQVGPKGSVSGRVATVKTIRPPTGKRSEQHGILTGALYLSAGATIEVDTLTIEDGILGGTYTWPTDFSNVGTVSPGDGAGAVGTFTVAADYAQTSAGILAIDLGGLTPDEEHDVLSVAGTAVLGGVLRVSRIGEYIPTVGDRYKILSADAVTGAFSSVEADELSVAVSYESDAVYVEILSTVAVESETELPSQYALETNFPNPFQSQTTIPFVLPESAHVKLAVYDLYGRLVRTLVEGQLPAGRHEVVFDAAGMASGTFVIRFETGAFRDSKPMVLVN